MEEEAERLLWYILSLPLPLSPSLSLPSHPFSLPLAGAIPSKCGKINKRERTCAMGGERDVQTMRTRPRAPANKSRPKLQIKRAHM